MRHQIQGSGVARLQVILAALLFSTGGAVVKSISFDAWQVAFLRSSLAVLALLFFLPETRRGWSRRRFLRALPVALAYAVTMVLYMVANKLTSAANAIFLQYTAPLYVLLLGPFLLKERVERRDGVFMAVLALGMGAFFVGTEVATATAADPFRGNVVAVITGLTWGLTLLGLRWLEGGGSAGAPMAVIVGNALAAVLTAPLALPLGPGATPQDWLGISFLGVVQIALAYVFLTRAVGKIRALEVSLFLLLELLFNPLLAWAVHGEVPGFWPRVGCTLILAGTLLWTWSGRRRAVAA